MKPSLLLALGLAAAALLASGCATAHTHTGKNTYILGGLVTVKTGDYQEPSAVSDRVDTTKWFGHGNPSGTSTSILWDAVKFTDY